MKPVNFNTMTVEQMSALFSGLSTETLNRINDVSRAVVYDRFMESFVKQSSAEAIAEALAS